MRKKSVDILDLDIPNVCFSLANSLPENDSRRKKLKKQRIERGFDSTELWNLDKTITDFVLPRLRAFAKNIHGYPACFEDGGNEWEEILTKMLKSFELLSRDFFASDEEQKLIDEGLELFAKYYGSLWN